VTFAAAARSRDMNTTRKILTATTVVAFATTGIATAADAPIVSEQHFIAGHAPVTIPGTGVQKGEWMGSKARFVYRDVTLEGDQRVRVTLRAPKGRTIRGLAPAEGSKISFVAVDRDYVGKRKTTVRARLAPGADGEQTARIGALVR
jgi:hypothetical protein